ncbi:MAG: hypothetical protein ACFBSE_21845, partial [Prochloraceae cyanobacterium]
KIKKINLKTPDKFPYFENDVVVIRSNEGSGSEIKVLSGRWGIVNKVGEFSCEVKVCNGLLEDVRAEELEGVKLSDEDKESAIALMGRLQKLAEIEIVDELVNEIIWGIGKKEKIKLTPLQNEILTLIEKRLNRLEN